MKSIYLKMWHIFIWLIYPERFSGELGIELNSVDKKNTENGQVNNLLSSIYCGESYMLPEDIRPEDYQSPPENRFDLVTEACIEWIDRVVKITKIQIPIYVCSPDSNKLYSLRSKSWVEMAFWH